VRPWIPVDQRTSRLRSPLCGESARASSTRSCSVRGERQGVRSMAAPGTVFDDPVLGVWSMASLVPAASAPQPPPASPPPDRRAAASPDPAPSSRPRCIHETAGDRDLGTDPRLRAAVPPLPASRGPFAQSARGACDVAQSNERAIRSRAQDHRRELRSGVVKRFCVRIVTLSSAPSASGCSPSAPPLACVFCSCTAANASAGES
jgi:hypothetical protein